MRDQGLILIRKAKRCLAYLNVYVCIVSSVDADICCMFALMKDYNL